MYLSPCLQSFEDIFSCCNGCLLSKSSTILSDSRHNTLPYSLFLRDKTLEASIVSYNDSNLKHLRHAKTEHYRTSPNWNERDGEIPWCLFCLGYFVPPIPPLIIKRVEFSLAFERSRRERNKLSNFNSCYLDLIKRKCEGKENCSNCSTKCNPIRVILRIVYVSEKVLQLSRWYRLIINLKHMVVAYFPFSVSCY